jgi:hypothetical protein
LLEVFGPDGQRSSLNQIEERSALPWLLAATTASGLFVATSYHAVVLDDSGCAFQTVVAAPSLPYPAWPDPVKTTTPAAAFQAHADCIAEFAAVGSASSALDAGSGPIVTGLITGVTVRTTPGRPSAGREGWAPLTASLWDASVPVGAPTRDDGALVEHRAYVMRAVAAWDARPPGASRTRI